MGHQPFETWLMEEHDLSSAEKQELSAHLGSCPACTTLKDNLETTGLLMKTAAVVSPRPGFSERWKVTQAERRAIQHRRQNRIFLLSSFAGAAVCLGGLYAVLRITNFTFADLLVFLARVAAGLIGFFDQARVFLGVNVSGPLSLIFWILVSSGFCILVLIWIYTLWRISFQGAFKNEKDL